MGDPNPESVDSPHAGRKFPIEPHWTDHVSVTGWRIGEPRNIELRSAET
jgi:hypothetical protein